MPPSDFQSRVLRTISKNRKLESHVAGGIALNLDRFRFSYDIDIFHDNEAAVKMAVEADAHSLQTEGFTVEIMRNHPMMVTARVSRDGEETSVDWVHDSAVRFFPAQPDDRLGYTLHPFDIATNKALAAAARREPRDAIDLVSLHESYVPLGAIAWAAVGKDEGYSPELLLNFIARFARYNDDDLVKVKSQEAWSAADLSVRLKAAVSDAQTFVESMPADLVGHAFTLRGEVVQPDPETLDRYVVVPPTAGGSIWPTVD